MGEVDIPQRWYEDNGDDTAEVWSLVAFANRPDLDKERWLARLGETGTAASVNPCTRHASQDTVWLCLARVDCQLESLLFLSQAVDQLQWNFSHLFARSTPVILPSLGIVA